MAEPSIQKIKSKLLLLVGITITAVISLSVWDLYTGRVEAIALAERQSADYARALAEHTESAFAETDSVLRTLIHDFRAVGDIEKSSQQSLHQQLRRQHKNSPQVGALFLVNQKGVMFTNTQEEYPPRKIPVDDRDYFHNYLNNPGIDFTIGKPVMSRLVKRWRFNLMRPLNNPEKPFNGLIAAAFEVDYFKRFLSQDSLGARGRIILIRNDGIPLVIQPFAENAYQTDFTKTKLFRDMLPQKASGTFHVNNSALDNADRIISYKQLSRFPVIAIVSLHLGDVLKPWLHKAAIQSTLTIALCLLIITLTRTIFRYLDKLQRTQTILDERTTLLAATVKEQRIILSNVSVGISLVKNRTIQWANEYFDMMFAYEPGSTRGINTRSFYAVEAEYQRIGIEGYRGLENGRKYSAEVMMKGEDGKIFPCLVAGQALDPEKPDEGSIWVIHDISEIKTAESERLSLLEEVQHARHLENLGTLAGGIAHDFNNLLMIMQGAADLSRLKLEPQSPVQPYLNKITDAIKSAARLCQQMLVYSGKGLNKLEKISLNSLLDPSVLAPLGKTGIKLSMNVPLGLPPIKANPIQLRQAVISVIKNAVEAVGTQSGTISISGFLQDCSDGRWVTLEITDNGCGMNKEIQSRVFDPFFSTKFVGRGLDMAAVSGVIKGLNGHIEITSQPEKGTTVRLVIPACLD